MHNKCIVYPVGSHGSFLKMLLNYMAGIEISNTRTDVYDFVAYSSNPIFVHTHIYPDFEYKSDDIVNIQVQPASYLKYLAMALHRGPPGGILIDDLVNNTFDKLHHNMFRFWIPLLSRISSQTTGNVPRSLIREWVRYLFADNGKRLTHWMKPNIIESAGYVVGFEDFYTGNIVNQCRSILEHFDIAVINSDAEKFLPEFYQNIKYRLIDVQASAIIENIKLKQVQEIPPSNIFVEAWVDNWMASELSITPIKQDQYFTNTQQIFNTYQI